MSPLVSFGYGFAGGVTAVVVLLAIFVAWATLVHDRGSGTGR